MKFIANINSLLSDVFRTSTHPKAKLKGVELATEFQNTSNSAIDPEDVIAWLVTQPNANGTLYLENVVRQYMRVLRTAPAKLQIPVVFDIRNVFTCRTPEELNACWDMFRSAPNYKQVTNSTSGMFFAGMGCYMRYLQHLSGTVTIEDLANTPKEPQHPQLQQTEAESPTESREQTDCDRPELCAKNCPLTSTIDDQAVVPPYGLETMQQLDDEIDARFFSLNFSDWLKQRQINTWRKFLDMTPEDMLLRGEIGLHIWREYLQKQMVLYGHIKDTIAKTFPEPRSLAIGLIFKKKYPITSFTQQTQDCLQTLGVQTLGDLLAVNKYNVANIYNVNSKVWCEIKAYQQPLFIKYRKEYSIIINTTPNKDVQKANKHANILNKSDNSRVQAKHKITGGKRQSPLTMKESKDRLSSAKQQKHIPSLNYAESPPALFLSTRTQNCLKRLHVNTWHQMANLTEERVMKIPGAGVKTWREISAFQKLYCVDNTHTLSLHQTPVSDEPLTTVIANKKVEQQVCANLDINASSIVLPSVYPNFGRYMTEFLNDLIGLRDSLIVDIAWGPGTGKNVTLEETSTHFGLTKERIRQILVKAEEKIKRSIKLNEFVLMMQVKEVLSAFGGLLSIQVLSEKLQFNNSWEAPPHPVPLCKLLGINDNLIVNTAMQTVALIDSGCSKCKKAATYLETLVLHEKQPIHINDAACRAANNCRATCSSNRSIPDTFPVDMVRVWFNSTGKIRIHHDTLMSETSWILRYGNSIHAVVQASLAELGCPTYYKDLAVYIRDTNNKHKRITDRSVHACLTIYPKMFKIAGRGVYGLAHWDMKPYITHGAAVIRLLEAKGALSASQITNALTINNEFKTANILTAIAMHPAITKREDGLYTLSPAQVLNSSTNDKSNGGDKNVYAPSGQADATLSRVDLSRPELCAKSRPVTCTINGQVVEPDRQNWSQLLVAITELFIAKKSPRLAELVVRPMHGRKAFFLAERSLLLQCTRLSNGKWVCTNYNPQIIVTIIRNLCQHCGVDLDEVIITYERKADKPVRPVQPYLHHAYDFPAVAPKPVLDTAVVEQLTGVLSSHFANGYRLNSPIEMARFRSFAAEDLGENLVLSDDDLKSYIAACGTIFDGKVYAVSVQAKGKIKELAEDYFAGGAQAIFFSEFYAKNEKWLFAASVVSEQMLIDILHRLFPKLPFTQTYFGYTDASVASVLEREILRVWEDEVVLTYRQLTERLKYIPIERIKFALSQNGDFIWSSVETYTHVSRVDITDEEQEAIRAAAVRECNVHGYVSVTDLPFADIEERNYEISVTAVHDAVYRISLSDKYDKRGRIITRKGDVFDALTIMKEYCQTIDRCSFDDLLNFERELTGEEHRWIPMEAANSVLVRIDKDTYVADRYVHFDVDVIDDAIGLFIQGDYLPVMSFTTFGAFSDCGQTWNLFLLESYCRRFSRAFRFDAPSVNSRNAGAVIRKSCGMDYTEIMIDAVADADVPLKDSNIGKFLYEHGYIGKRTTVKVNEIKDKARAIRERRD